MSALYKTNKLLTQPFYTVSLFLTREIVDDIIRDMSPDLGKFVSGLRRSKNSAVEQPEGPQAGITAEVARADLIKLLNSFGTAGAGTDKDRAAQMVLQTLQVLRNRLDNPAVLKLLYVDNPQASGMLPSLANDTVTRVCSGEITSDEAGIIIDKALPQYAVAFQDMGVTPTAISMFFSPTPTDTEA